MLTICSSRLLSVVLISVASFSRADVAPEAIACAQKLVARAPKAMREASCISIVPDGREGIGSFGQHVFRIDSCATSPAAVGWFYTDGDVCGLISGNVPVLTGASWPLSASEEYAVAEFNRLLLTRRDNAPKDNPVAYVTAVLHLARPFSTVRVVNTASDIPWTPATRRRDKKRLAKLERIVQPPFVVAGSETSYISAYVWSDPGGTIEVIRALIWADGRIAMTPIRIDEAIGDFSSQVFIPRVPQ